MTLERPGPVVEVEWVDSTGHDGWHPPEDARYLVMDTEEGIVITQGVGGVGQWLGSMAIPRAAIVKLVHVGGKK